MSPFDSKRPPRTFDAAGGVKVNVKDPPPEPQRAPARAEPPPKVVAAPPTLSRLERDRIIAAIYKEHGKFLEELVLSETGIVPESKKDLRQHVLLTLTTHVEKYGAAPPNVRGYLHEVVEHAASNHRRTSRRRIRGDADPSAVISPELDPEGAAELAERRRRLERYLVSIPADEAEAFRGVGLWGLTFDQAAEAVGRPRGTVVREYKRAVKKLEDRVAASDRPALLGARRAARRA